MAIARPLKQGSAGTSELVYHTLCLLMDLPLIPILSPKAWDIQAMFFPDKDAFVNWFLAHCIRFDIQISETIKTETMDVNFLDQIKEQSRNLVEYIYSQKTTFSLKQTITSHYLNQYGLPQRVMYDFYSQHPSLLSPSETRNFASRLYSAITLKDCNGNSVVSIAIKENDKVFMNILLGGTKAEFAKEGERQCAYTLEFLKLLQKYFFPRYDFLDTIHSEHQKLIKDMKLFLENNPQGQAELDNYPLRNVHYSLSQSLDILHRLFSTNPEKYSPQLAYLNSVVKVNAENETISPDIPFSKYMELMDSAYEITRQPLTEFETAIINAVRLRLASTHCLSDQHWGDPSDGFIECEILLNRIIADIPKQPQLSQYPQRFLNNVPENEAPEMEAGQLYEKATLS